VSLLVLYDRDCGFCRWTVAWALRRDRAGVLEVAPIQSDTGTRLLADMDPAERLRSAHAVHADGRRSSAGAAMRDVLEALPATRRLGRLAALSDRATELAYRFVANNRSMAGRLVPQSAKERADRLLAERERAGRPG
jgi:predicted DCC family thiol-disulfide oxidoreductase YuxK